jgi:hypothetical protein
MYQHDRATAGKPPRALCNEELTSFWGTFTGTSIRWPNKIVVGRLLRATNSLNLSVTVLAEGLNVAIIPTRYP